MAIYNYEVVDRSGKLLTGNIEADHELTAIDRLRKMDYMVLNIKAIPSRSPGRFLFLKSKVRIGDLSLFSRQLAAMLDAGIPITRALSTLSRQVSNPTLKETLEEVTRNVEGGASLTDALSAFPQVFSKLYTGMIHAGEMSGTLEQTLNRLSEQLQKDKTLNDNIRSATFYPVGVAIFALLILFGMMFFLVPVFVGFFPEGATLPMPTKILISISDVVRNFWYLLFVFFIGIIIATRFYVKSPSGERAWDGLKYKLPVFGDLIQKAVIARFSRTLSTLLGGGIPVVQALESAGPASGSILIADAVNMVCERIQEGQNIAEPLEKSGYFPPMVIHMISVGEETGSLPTLLNRIAEFYEDEVATMTKGLTALIEPILLVFVGLIIGGMLIALYLPIFTVVTQMG